MFKTAAAKIAHNSTLPALGGNQDLRPLQDLITAEKAVLISLQKLSVDYAKASEALRTWGLNEGDDLGDILSASTTLLNHFSSALSQYATHEHTMRDQLKAIRTREEALEELKRRRRTVVRKAEDADKKLSKMSPEHKNLPMQTETLNRLRDEIRTMDSDIMTEEAALGDFKRSATRAWMGLKFGGLLECCEKGSIAAEFGKMTISEISEEMTQPGLPRSLYYGQPKTENFVSEAGRCINEVVLSTVPSVGSRDRRQYDQGFPPQSGYSSNQGYPSSPTHENKPQPPPPMQDDNSQRTFGDSMGSASGPFGASSANQSNVSMDQSFSSFSPRVPPQIQEEPPEKVAQTLDDFGLNSRSPGLIESSNTSGGRFATFPVKTRAPGSGGGYSLQDPAVGLRQQDQSFSASVAEALDDRTSLDTGRPTEGTPNSYAGRNAGGQIPWTGPGQTSYQFTAPAPNNVLSSMAGSTSSSSLPPPPPGAAPPSFANPWAGSNREDPIQAANHSRVNASLSEDALLAYMTSVQDDLHAEDEPSSPAASTLVAPSQSEEEQRISRHVKFGEIEDINEQMEKKKSLEKETQERNAALGEGTSSESVSTQTAVGGNEEKWSNSSSPNNNKPSSHRVPPPTIFTDIDEQDEQDEQGEQEQDEQALNAAAAHDVARELDALNTKQSSPPDFGNRQEAELPRVPDRGRLPTIPTQNDQVAERDHSPLAPPNAPYASTRSVSPHRYADLNSNAPLPTPYGAPYTPAQPYQDPGSYGPTTPDNHATSSSSLPPRFQALNRSSDNQLPPRFQGTQQHQIPPRFQAGGSPSIPSTMSSPEPPDQGRYQRPLGTSSPYTRSSSSLNASASSSPGAGSTTAGGPRTISAAAFKRPKNTSTDNLGTSGEPPFMKKSLPSSPYPLRDQGERNVSPTPNPTVAAAAATAPASSSGPPTLPPIESGPQTELEDEYDYISAYVNSSNPNSPTQRDFSNPVSSHPGRVGGYGEGRFATDLENEGLR